MVKKRTGRVYNYRLKRMGWFRRHAVEFIMMGIVGGIIAMILPDAAPSLFGRKRKVPPTPRLQQTAPLRRQRQLAHRITPRRLRVIKEMGQDRRLWDY